MSKLVFVAVALCLLCAVDAKVLSNRKAFPSTWTQGERASPIRPINFIVALTQRNLDILESTFWAVSDPKSPKYQNFMTREQILEIVSPPKAEHDRVVAWLKSHGARNIKSVGDALEVHTNVAVAERLFGTKFFHFTHKENTERTIVRQLGEVTIPDELAHTIHMVAGLSEFPVSHYRAIPSPGNGIGIIPETVQLMYGTPNYTETTISSNTSNGVIEFEAQYFSPSDLADFATKTDLTIPPVPASRIVGFNDPSSPGIEAELDIQYVAGVGLKVPSWFWIEGGTTWLYGYATHFFNTANVPYVVSISYGWSEADQCEEGIGAEECQQLGVDSAGYVTRVNAEFQKIGLRGVSIIVASGDSGANGRTDPDCTMPKLLPDYPAASPFVTSVGATQVNQAQSKFEKLPPICFGYQCVSGGTEVAVTYNQANFASGGGFSNVGAQPAYQTDAVNAYFNSGVALPPASYYNKTGRGYPDVAGFGSDVLIMSGGEAEPVGGTSCASPIVAGLASLLNDYSLKTTGKPLGFLNPLFYEAAADDSSTFNDITVGDNKCTEDGCSPTCKGYLATKGWDPVTGLGTPQYPALLAYLQKVFARKADASVVA